RRRRGASAAGGANPAPSLGVTTRSSLTLRAGKMTIGPFAAGPWGLRTSRPRLVAGPLCTTPSRVRPARQEPPMSRARKPFSSALVAAACAALPAVLIACDKVESDATRADKSVQKVMETTLAQTPSLPPPVRPTSDAEVSKLVQE